jgi:ribosomal-protein-alanine N-acetyltransferase
MTAVALSIRALELDDLGDIETIEQRAYPTPWSRSMFASELAKPTSICLGAFEGDELVGYVINSRYVDAWHIMNVAVMPERQRRGIATALLERLFELTRHDERRGFTLEVRVSNEGAIHLYEELGFEARGVRRGYYTDNREDVPVPDRAVADEPPPLHVELLRPADDGAGGEHLAAPRVDHRQAVAVGVERRCARHLDVERERQRAGDGEADADAREAARPAADDDALDARRVADEAIDGNEHVPGPLGALARARGDAADRAERGGGVKGQDHCRSSRSGATRRRARE